MVGWWGGEGGGVAMGSLDGGFVCGGLVGGEGGGVAMGSFSSSFLSFIASMLYIRFSCSQPHCKCMEEITLNTQCT